MADLVSLKRVNKLNKIIQLPPRYFSRLSCSAIVCACSQIFVTAEAKPTSICCRRGEFERRNGPGDVHGEPYGLRWFSNGDLGDTGVAGKEGVFMPIWLDSDTVLETAGPPAACSGLKPLEKSRLSIDWNKKRMTLIMVDVLCASLLPIFYPIHIHVEFQFSHCHEC